tara:strand:+ start:367 stop:555 length:189 start_codon:yes stop_codon:yes gene_type:complete
MAVTPKYKVVGPFSPKEFSDPATLSTTIADAVGTLGGTSATSLVASDPVMILGNIFILVTYV